MVEEAKEEGFPVDVEEKEAYFMNEVARGEQLAQDGKNPTRSYPVFGLEGVAWQQQTGSATLSTNM